MMGYDYGKCHVCGGRIEERLTDQSIRDGGDWVIIGSVPTGVCMSCGEQVLRWNVTERLETILKERENTTPASHIEVPVFAF